MTVLSRPRPKSHSSPSIAVKRLILLSNTVGLLGRTEVRRWLQLAVASVQVREV